MGSGFGHKIGRDGGIDKKKRRESGICEPLLWTLIYQTFLNEWNKFLTLCVPLLHNL